MKKNDPVEHYTGVVPLSGLLGRIIVPLPTSNTC